jgi:hypothetical protein
MSNFHRPSVPYVTDSSVVSNFCFSQWSATWPILIDHRCGQICYKLRGSEFPSLPPLFLFLCFILSVYSNVSLFNFSIFVCNWPHSPSSVSHIAPFCVFIRHGWVWYVNRRGTFCVLIVGVSILKIGARHVWLSRNCWKFRLNRQSLLRRQNFTRVGRLVYLISCWDFLCNI